LQAAAASAGLADLREAEPGSRPQKETPAVGDMTAGALSLAGAFVTAMRANRDLQRLIL
jgi:crotonobetainyl-CoA:carnitine CoA-transferase CaiB-like acyl-CoA transferase